jgi:glycosyltransferase involved in cell wall biosynthesis
MGGARPRVDRAMTRPVRVAHVIHNLRPGGTERRLLAVVAGLDRARFDPVVVCIDGLGELAEEAMALGLEPFVLGRAFRIDASGIPRLARFLRRERVQVVHGWLSLANAFARIAATAARVPVRIAAEGGALTTTDVRRARRDTIAERVLAPLTDAYIANSEAVAASLLHKGLPGAKIVVIPNGVPVLDSPLPEERVHLRFELGAGRDDFLVGMVARIDPDFKDHETFVATVAALASEGRPVRAAVIGDGAGRYEVERRVVELGISERVVFTGYRPDAARLIAALDLSVLLTYSEGFSNVVLESMAAAVPILATAIPSNREAVESGVHGLLVPVRDLEATIAAARRLMDDRGLAEGLGRAACRRVAERYSLDAQAASTMRLYERLLREKAGTL